METYKIQPQSNESGFALIMALVISSVVLSIGLSMLSITIKQVDLAATARESEAAFQAASAAMECALMTRISEGDRIATTTPTSNLTFDCGGFSAAATISGDNTRRRYEIDTDWVSSDGQERYVSIEMFVIGEAAAPRTYTPSDRDFSATCAAGAYCTYIFAEGYNRSEADIASGVAFSVQREITAEF